MLTRLHGHLAALVAKPAFWTVFIVIGVAIPIARTVNTPLPPPLPVLGRPQPAPSMGDDPAAAPTPVSPAPTPVGQNTVTN